MAREIQIAQRKPSEAHVLRLEVLRSERVSESFQRITVGGEGLDRLEDMGFDQWFRLFMPGRGQEEFRLPTRSSDLWYAQWLMTPRGKRPGCRNYTVRERRADEFDIDFVIHLAPGASAPEGVAAPWALNARRGDPLGVLDQGVMWAPKDDVSESLIVADESGLPAVEGVLRSLPAGARGRAIVEVPTAGDVRELVHPAGFPVDWIVRGEHDPDAAPGAAALRAATEAPAPDASGYGFAVGESALVTGMRRHLVAAGLPKDRVHFCGFWKRGVARH